jgi:hypothetical protein
MSVKVDTFQLGMYAGIVKNHQQERHRKTFCVPVPGGGTPS